MSRSEVTYEALKAIANSILDFFQFTGEFSTSGNAIPVLDTEMWARSPGQAGRKEMVWGATQSREGESGCDRSRSKSRSDHFIQILQEANGFKMPNVTEVSDY